MADEMSVNDAARELGVSADAVRKLLASGALAGRKRGRDWVIDGAGVRARARSAPATGRPLAAATAWGVILEWSQAAAPAWPSAEFMRSARWRGRRWLAHHSLAEEPSKLRLRAVRETFRIHPSQVAKLREAPHLLLTGLSAAEQFGLVGGADDRVELYAPAGSKPLLMRRHGLLTGEGQACIRWVDDEIWDGISGNIDEHLPSRHAPKYAPRGALALDLLESTDPRAAREAQRVLQA